MAEGAFKLKELFLRTDNSWDLGVETVLPGESQGRGEAQGRCPGCTVLDTH